MSDVSEKYGLIAGNGRFPIMVLESARQQSLDVVVAAIKEETFPEIEACGYPVHWLGLGQLGKLVRLFRQSGVRSPTCAATDLKRSGQWWPCCWLPRPTSPRPS